MAFEHFEWIEGDTLKIMRPVGALLILLVVLVAFVLVLARYNDAVAEGSTSPDTTASGAQTTRSSDATGGTSATSTAVPYVIVLVQDLKLRAGPTRSAAILKTLDKGQQLIYLESTTGWYHVRDDVGIEGWVAAGGEYSQFVGQ